MTVERNADNVPQTASRSNAWWRRGWLRAAVSVGLLAWLCASIDWNEEGRLLHGIRWGWLLAALALHVINRPLSALKWQVLLRAKGFSYPYGHLLRTIWISNFFGHFLPAAVGGDSLRMWSVARGSDRPVEAMSTVIIERLTGVMSLAALAVLGGLWSSGRWGEHAILLMLIAPLGALMAGLALLWTAPGERLLRWLLARVHRVPGHQFLAQVHEAMRSCRHQPGPVLASLAVSEVIQLSRVAATYMLARALGSSLSLGEALVLIPSAMFIAMLPISVGGIGVHEGAFVALLGIAKVGTSAAFGIAFLSRFVTLASNLPGAVLFLLERPRRRQDEARPRAAHPLRVLWVADKLGYGDRLHGVGQYYLTVVPALEGVEVIPAVLRSSNGLVLQFADRGVRLREFRLGRFSPRTISALNRCIRREGIDVLHLHGYGASIFGRLAGWLTRTPVVIHQHDGIMPPWHVRLSDRALRPLTARMIAVSESVKRFCVSERATPPDRVTVIPLATFQSEEPTPDDLRRWRSQLGLPAGAKVIGAITRFHPVKGTGCLIEAFPDVLQAVPEAHLVLWGDGPEREALEMKARALGVADRVRFAGHQPDAARYLTLLDCFVLPSLSEGFPFALLEAMMAARPIVATRVGGVPEIIRDGQEALLVAPQNARLLAQAMIRLLRDPALAKRLGESAKAASARYTIERHVDDLRRVYEEVTGAGGGS